MYVRLSTLKYLLMPNFSFESSKSPIKNVCRMIIPAQARSGRESGSFLSLVKHCVRPPPLSPLNKHRAGGPAGCVYQTHSHIAG